MLLSVYFEAGESGRLDDVWEGARGDVPKREVFDVVMNCLWLPGVDPDMIPLVCGAGLVVSGSILGEYEVTDQL